jgi:Pectinacetylesterase
LPGGPVAAAAAGVASRQPRAARDRQDGDRVTGRGSRTLALLLVLASLAAAVAGCGGGGDDDAGAAATSAQTTTQTSSTTTSPGHQGWERVVPGGDCKCSDGSEFSFWVRKASPKKVIFFLQGGGACFSAETCAPDRGLYRTKIEAHLTGGIFDFADKRNPFADYSVVYVPYCTGDVHLGNASRQYAPGLTVQHKGYVNGTAALDRLVASFPRATRVVVAGESAGSVAAPLYAGLMSDRLPDARITVLADGSGSYPDVRRVDEILATWGFGRVIPHWPENAGLAADEWSLPGFFIQSGRHDPKIVFARHDYAYDENQVSWYPFLGIRGKNPLSLMDRNEAQIEGAGVNLLSYTAPGDGHTVLGDEGFYTETVNGEKLVDWVSRLIEGQPVDDVHCQKCRISSAALVRPKRR